jgi:uncharacterized protein
LPKSITLKQIDPKLIVSHLNKSISSLQAVYLYGSFLSASFSDESDLDIAIKTEQRLDNQKRWQIQEDLASIYGRDVDLLDLDRASLVMQFEVISTGERIYCAAENTTALYETLVYSRYLDFNQIRKPIIEEITKRGSVYGNR